MEMVLVVAIKLTAVIFCLWIGYHLLFDEDRPEVLDRIEDDATIYEPDRSCSKGRA